jgi:3',5'-cyclic AMP phosphodiesterase CpdA
MAQSLQVAVTADLHWGHHDRGMASSRLLFEHVRQHPPDILVLAGDVGTGALYGDCLAQLAEVSCRKAVVPGNHDIWVMHEADYDSLHLYETELPRVSVQHGFHYLDHGPLVLADADVALVGSINWYDYSWALDALRRSYPGELHRLTSKHFSRGRHNDVNFVRWALDDVGFTARAVGAFERHLLAALEQVSRIIVVTHHPPIYDLGFPRPEPPTSLDSLLWDAFCGNRSLEELLLRHAGRVAFAFCGHTHRARQADWHGVRGFNVGGDYHFKRLLCLDCPAGTVEEFQFGEAD